MKTLQYLYSTHADLLQHDEPCLMQRDYLPRLGTQAHRQSSSISNRQVRSQRIVLPNQRIPIPFVIRSKVRHLAATMMLVEKLDQSPRVCSPPPPLLSCELLLAFFECPGSVHRKVGRAARMAQRSPPPPMPVLYDATLGVWYIIWPRRCHGPRGLANDLQFRPGRPSHS